MNTKNKNIHTILLKIISSIKKEYPLTLTQKLKLTILQDNIINNDQSKQFAFFNIDEHTEPEKIVKNIFTLLIKDNNKKNNNFYKYITESAIEFYTLKYCTKYNIPCEPNIEYILFFRELIDDIRILNEKEFDSIVLRSSAENLAILSNNKERIYIQFEANHKQKTIQKKK